MSRMLFVAVVALVMMAQKILAVAKTSGLYGAGQDPRLLR
jgi:hypothetical protein